MEILIKAHKAVSKIEIVMLIKKTILAVYQVALYFIAILGLAQISFIK